MRGASLQRASAPYVLLAPFALVFAVFTAYPLYRSIVLSTEQTFGPSAATFIGLDNFRYLMTDPMFWTALRNTVVFTLGSVFIQLPLSLGLALLLAREDIRFRGVFRLLFFAPVLVGPVFVGMLFRLLLESRTGIVNILLHRLVPDWHFSLAGHSFSTGFSLEFPWMTNYIMLAMILAALWMWVGFNMVYFLAALQNVRRDLVEAATIDGAGALSRFRHVTLPAIRPVGGFVVLLSVIGSFQVFELPWLLIAEPPGYENRGLTIVMYLYETGFKSGDLGLASAIGWIMALILMGVAAVYALSARADAEVAP